MAVESYGFIHLILNIQFVFYGLIPFLYVMPHCKKYFFVFKVTLNVYITYITYKLIGQNVI